MLHAILEYLGAEEVEDCEQLCIVYRPDVCIIIYCKKRTERNTIYLGLLRVV